MSRYLLKDQAEKLYAAVEGIGRSLEKDLIGPEQNLTKPQLRTLMSISHAKCCTMSELGRLTGYPTSALTGIVDRMMKKKLVRRIRDDNDRRIVKVTATPSGIELAAGFRRKLIRCISVVLEKMSPEEREMMVLTINKAADGFLSPDGHKDN